MTKRGLLRAGFVLAQLCCWATAFAQATTPTSPASTPPRAALGVSCAPQNSARIISVSEGSAAAAAGLLGGDVISAVDGRPIGSCDALVLAIAQHQPGDVVQLSVQSPGKSSRTVAAKLLAPNPFAAGECEYGAAAFDMELGIKNRKNVVVRQVGPESARAGIQIGDIITDIEGKKLEDSTVQELYSDVGNRHVPGDTVRVKLHKASGLRQEVDPRLGCLPYAPDPRYLGVWKAAATKPAVPEIVNRYRVLAETAYENKNVYFAMVYYERGLAAYPYWPQGWFNAALLRAEMDYFDVAAHFMKNYLELAPDSPQAKSAREQMYVWEEKAKQ